MKVTSYSFRRFLFQKNNPNGQKVQSNCKYGYFVLVLVPALLVSEGIRIRLDQDSACHVRHVQSGVARTTCDNACRSIRSECRTMTITLNGGH